MGALESLKSGAGWLFSQTLANYSFGTAELNGGHHEVRWWGGAYQWYVVQ